MKTLFAKRYISSKRGCYDRVDLEELACYGKGTRNKGITIEELHRDLPPTDFYWFLGARCEMTIEERGKFAIRCIDNAINILDLRFSLHRTLMTLKKYVITGLRDVNKYLDHYKNEFIGHAHDNDPILKEQLSKIIEALQNLILTLKGHFSKDDYDVYVAWSCYNALEDSKEAQERFHKEVLGFINEIRK